MKRLWHTFAEGQRRRPQRTVGYAEMSSTTPARIAHTTICCLVLNPSFFCTPDTALRTVSGLTSLTSANLLIAQPLSKLLQDLHLPVRQLPQPLDAAVPQRTTHRPRQPPRRVPRNAELTLSHLTQRREQLLLAGILLQVAGGASRYRPNDRVLLVRCRQQ